MAANGTKGVSFEGRSVGKRKRTVDSESGDFSDSPGSSLFSLSSLFMKLAVPLSRSGSIDTPLANAERVILRKVPKRAQR